MIEERNAARGGKLQPSVLFTYVCIRQLITLGNVIRNRLYVYLGCLRFCLQQTAGISLDPMLVKISTARAHTCMYVLICGRKKFLIVHSNFGGFFLLIT